MDKSVTKTEVLEYGVRFYKRGAYDVRCLIDDTKTPMYCAMDIAAMTGYIAPSKALSRTPFPKKKMQVSWKSGKRTGVVQCWFFTKENALKFMRKGMADQEAVKWFQNEVVPAFEGIPAQARKAEIADVKRDEKREGGGVEKILAQLDKIILEAALAKQGLLEI